MMLLYIWAAAAVAAFLLYCRQTYSRFSKHGVKHDRALPLLGTMSPLLLRRKHLLNILGDLYSKYPDERFVGSYEFTKPVVVIRDVELIKRVTVKDFESFLDHRSFATQEAEPFFERNLFSLKGEPWKDMRSTLSPAFTSSKMKLMLPLIVEVGEQVVLSLEKKIRESETGWIEIESKDLSTHYANDIIATCAFGLKVDSQEDPNNQFYMMGHKALNFNALAAILKFIGYTCAPYVMKLLRINLFPEDVKQFFTRLVLSTMEDREARGVFRPDMIHLLMEAKKGRLSHEESAQDTDAGFATVEESNIGRKTTNRVWSDTDLVAQAFLFFIAGFETVSTAMTFLLYELALHPDIQDTLAREIWDHADRTGGKLDYNSIQTMTYMDMVVSESLRLWPPALATDRLCIRDYNLGRPNGTATSDYIIRKGEGINIPISSLHRDPRYFPDPLKFDPERYSAQNRHSIRPSTYLPFGAGPRNCIGSRFALCELKVLLYQLLQTFELSPCGRTAVPCKLARDNFNLRIEGGHWLRMTPRL